MATSKKQANAASKLTLPLPGTNQPLALVNACTQQVATIQANPELANHPELQVAAINVLSQAMLLGQTITDLGKLRASVTALETKRGDDALTLRLLHANLEALLNIAAVGNKQAALAWGGKIVSRTISTGSTDAPVDAIAKATKTQGTVEVKCKAERGVVCYLVQMGSNAADPEAWPQPAISGGCKHTVPGLTPGQKVYFRIAIVRRGNVQGQWSSVLEVTVR